ncbi:hypothetical protein [Thiocapsa bogorovii]|nr:hypothetical protein [Thiocapsa bogorovii]UHD17688.1 hypothetical protein LT988_06465 [Thiocapsa bogorovii]
MTSQALNVERAHRAGLLGILPLHDDFAEEFTAIAGDLDLLISTAPRAKC